MESSACFKEKVFTFSTISLAVASFIVNLGFGVTLPYFPLFAVLLGAEVWHVGFIVVAFVLGRILFNDRAGRLSDLYGRKLIISLGAIGYALNGIAQVTSPYHSLIYKYSEAWEVCF